MKTYLINNKQFIIIALIWVLIGMYTSSIIYAVLPIMLFLLASKKMHLELLLGFFLILTLSDSRLAQLSFAADVKNIYIVFIALVSFSNMRKNAQAISFYKYFIPFFILAAISTSFSPDTSMSVQKVLSYILLFIFIPHYIFFVYQLYGTMLFNSVVYFVVIVLALGLVFNAVNPDIANLAGRYRGILGNPNGLGLYTFLFILLFATVNEHFHNLFSKYEKLFIYAFAMFCLLKCGARTSLVSVLMFAFFVRFYKMSSLLGFVIFIISAIVYNVVSDNLVDIIVSLGLSKQLRVDSLENGSGRIIAWKFAWDQIQSNFYFGKGFNYTEYLFRKNYDYLSRLGHQGAAHNSYLTLWLDTGLVGLLLFLGGILASFLRAAKKSKLAIPFLYCVLFSNYYESWITASLNPFTIQFLFILTIMFIHDIKPINKQSTIDTEATDVRDNAYRALED